MESSLSLGAIKRKSDRAAIASVIGFVIFLSSLLYSSSKVYSLQKRLSVLSSELDEKTKRLGETNKQLEEAAGVLGLSSEEIVFLKNHASLGSSSGGNLKDLVDSKRDAEKEIREYKALPEEKD